MTRQALQYFIQILLPLVAYQRHSDAETSQSTVHNIRSGCDVCTRVDMTRALASAAAACCEEACKLLIRRSNCARQQLHMCPTAQPSQRRLLDLLALHHEHGRDTRLWHCLQQVFVEVVGSTALRNVPCFLCDLRQRQHCMRCMGSWVEDPPGTVGPAHYKVSACPIAAYGPSSQAP